MTLYDTIILYLTIASDILNNGGTKANITNGDLMYRKATNYLAPSGEHFYFVTTINCGRFCVDLLLTSVCSTI